VIPQQLLDLEAPEAHDSHDDVLAGLLARPRRLPARLLYDARGAELFEQICELPEYYPTRNELALLAASLPDLARLVGPRVRVIEPGSGAATKTRMLLAALDAPGGYVPIDISGEQLVATARTLRRELPGLAIQPVLADFTALAALPPASGGASGTLVFFPGSTIGNFEPDAARAFLARFGALAGPGAQLLLGADANRDPASLVPAYDDAAGITAAFDRNVLAHLNRTRGATFDLDQFLHRAVWNARASRIEMHLVSRKAQRVRVGATELALERGEAIVTEHCYKHSRDALSALLASAGWHVREVFPDPEQRMHLWLASR
jgi:dimethylhistidine N-methyltransferase